MPRERAGDALDARSLAARCSRPALAEHLGEVLVAAPGQAHEVELAVALGEHPGQRVRGLERRDDALEARQLAEGRERLARR